METFSFRSLLYLTYDLSLVGTVLSLAGALYYLLWRPMRQRVRTPALAVAGADGGMEAVSVASLALERWERRAMPTFLLLCFGSNLAAMFSRTLEVRHWPAQTMYEVIPLGTTAGFLSGLILYYVLDFQRVGGIARGFVHLFNLLVFGLCAGFLHHTLGLDPTGRALPPALQSYWFPPHISAYMMGYFTFFIAAAASWLYFCCRVWRSVLEPGAAPLDRRTVALTALALAVCIPFGRYAVLLGPGLFLLSGLICWISVRRGGGMAWFDPFQEGADNFTWKIFVVGFPFLTAGLIQGALWAQEAWAIYWGWDSKEVSALISWLFYVVYLHLRYVAGWRGEKGMWILLFGGLSVYITFQLFGFLPASQSSLHRYTDMDVVPAEGMMGAPEAAVAE